MVRSRKKKKSRPDEVNLIDATLLREYIIKKLDADFRLGKNFICFVKFDQGGLFMYGGDVPGVIYTNNIFSAVCVGASSSEVAELKNLILKVASKVRGVFSENDFHQLMLRDFLSSYLKAVLDNMEIPLALAVEIVAVDVENNMINITSSGDFVEVDLNQSSERVFVAGCYDEKFIEKFRKKIMRLVKNCDGPVNQEKAVSITMALKKSLDIKNLNLYWYSLGELQPIKVGEPT